MGFDAIYLKANDPLTKRALWIREQRVGARVWRWCVLTDPAWEKAQVIASPALQGAAIQSEPTGLLRYARNDMLASWDLHWDDPGAPFRLMPCWMYLLPLPTRYESPHWNGRISGTLKLPSPSGEGQGEGEAQVWTLTHWPAQQGHLWGWKISKQWAWAHGNCFVEDHTAAFEILTSGGRTLLNLRSQQFNLTANTMRTWRCTRHEITPTHWNWEFTHADLKIAGQFRLGYAEMVALDYPTPQEGIRTCHNTKVGEGVIEVMRAGQPVLQLTAHDSLAWEFVR